MGVIVAPQSIRTTDINKNLPASKVILGVLVKGIYKYSSLHSLLEMKPTLVADEMFPEGAGPYMDLEEAGGSSGLLMDLAANEKAVHADFFNDFEDLFDDDNLE